MRAQTHIRSAPPAIHRRRKCARGCVRRAGWSGSALEVPLLQRRTPRVAVRRATACAVPPARPRARSGAPLVLASLDSRHRSHPLRFWVARMRSIAQTRAAQRTRRTAPAAGRALRATACREPEASLPGRRPPDSRHEPPSERTPRKPENRSSHRHGRASAPPTPPPLLSHRALARPCAGARHAGHAPLRFAGVAPASPLRGVPSLPTRRGLGSRERRHWPLFW